MMMMMVVVVVVAVGVVVFRTRRFTKSLSPCKQGGLGSFDKEEGHKTAQTSHLDHDEFAPSESAQPLQFHLPTWIGHDSSSPQVALGWPTHGEERVW